MPLVLKKIVLVLFVLLLASGGVLGYEYWQVKNALGKIHRDLASPTPCPTGQSAAYQHTSAATTVTPLGQAVVAHPTPTTAVGARITPTPPVIPCVKQPSGPPPTLSGKKRINILVLGSDNDQKYPGQPILSQTVMVVTIDPVHKKVSLLSIPRDFYLYVPGFGYHKLDEAMAEGTANDTSSDPGDKFADGVELTRATIEANFPAIHLDYYVWVGLNGFIKVINQVGGICLATEHPIVDDNYPNDIAHSQITTKDLFGYTRVYVPAGPQCLDGATGLEYARSRHADLIGDFGRGRRQQQVLIAIRNKVDQSSGLSSVLGDIGLLNSLADFVHWDIPNDQLQAMGDFAKGLNPASIHRLTLAPTRYSAPEIIYPNGPGGPQEDIVRPFWGPIDKAVKKMFRNPVSKPKHPKGPPKNLTSDEAAALLTRVVGATQVVNLPPVVAPSDLRGRIFFVKGGDIWSYSKHKFYQVTHAGTIRDPALSQNGRTLAYAQVGSPAFSDILLRNRNGRRSVVIDGNTNDGNVQDQVWAFSPALSPNGKTVVFGSDVHKLTDYVDTTAPIDLGLYLYDRRAGGTPTQITFPSIGAGGDADPRFDPMNSNKLLFTRYQYIGLDYRVSARLMLHNLGTGANRGLTPVDARISQPAWQPNARHIAYVKVTPGGTTIYDAPFVKWKLDTKVARPVDSGLVSHPVFSPDGKHLAYFKLIGDFFEVWGVNIKDGWPSGRPYMIFQDAGSGNNSYQGMDASSPLVWTK